MASHNELADDITQFLTILARFADEIDQIAKSGDIARLREHAAEFQSFVESMQQGEIQSRLREAELQASLDPLTEVGNRREFDRQIATRIQDGRTFCVLLFDIDNFKAVNDQFGHLCGDEVLKQLGARLRRQVRARDFVCRWGGDEFVVLLECGLSDAIARSRQITQWINGRYRATVQGRETRAEIGVSVGVVEHLAGETPGQLFERVDSSMYRQKNP
ncbi:MAG TPA: GGDEF domain-containing protein [Bryobacteraceae bacterium]